jgi:hypothetical protein
MPKQVKRILKMKKGDQGTIKVKHRTMKNLWIWTWKSIFKVAFGRIKFIDFEKEAVDEVFPNLLIHLRGEYKKALERHSPKKAIKCLRTGLKIQLLRGCFQLDILEGGEARHVPVKDYANPEYMDIFDKVYNLSKQE